MKENWRPPNWDKIVRLHCYDGDVVCKELDTFEDGADALYEALKTEGMRIERTDQVAIFINEKQKLAWHNEGWLVFIEDEEK